MYFSFVKFKTKQKYLKYRLNQAQYIQTDKIKRLTIATYRKQQLENYCNTTEWYKALFRYIIREGYYHKYVESSALTNIWVSVKYLPLDPKQTTISKSKLN